MKGLCVAAISATGVRVLTDRPNRMQDMSVSLSPDWQVKSHHVFFQYVAADIQPLAGHAALVTVGIHPRQVPYTADDLESKLSRINIRKAPRARSDRIPNWILHDFCGRSRSGPV